ncbi:CoA-binding protein [archaeon]|nr:MAG: CoA-binding protein [archaeon]
MKAPSRLFYYRIRNKIMDSFFNPSSVAIIGASRDPNKVGHVILRNLLDSGWKGKIFPVNPNAEEILNNKVYASVKDIPEPVDLAIVAVPAEIVLKVVQECGKKKIRNAIVISSGFAEIGEHKLEEKLVQLVKKLKIRMIGPNCLGTFDGFSSFDSLFLPRYRLKRPREGGISFICQSGAIGSAILDLATTQGFGFSKFASYGNAADIDESDLLEYVGNDPNTQVVCIYIEGVKDGRKFLEVARKVSKKKPIIAIKGGVTEQGNKAVMSHTGALAGSAEIYAGVFKQAGIIQAASLEEMFDFAKIFEKSMAPKGQRVQVITNGGGYGILSTDAIVKNDLKLAELSKETSSNLRKVFPERVIVKNPMDLIGDATTERYKLAMDACMADDNADVLLVVILYQTPLVTTDVVDVIIEAKRMQKKPIVVVSTGGEFTEVLRKNLEDNGIPTYTYPESAVKSIKALADYYKVR